MKITPGLRKSKYDPRDFSMSRLYGFVTKENLVKANKLLPEEFIIGMPKVKDQGLTDQCTAYATTSASELQEAEELNPQWTFAVSKMMTKDPNKWGQTTEASAKSHVKYGAIAQKAFDKLDLDIDDYEIRDIKKWSRDFFPGAKEYQKSSYFKIDKNFLSFDGLKFMLFRNRLKKRAIITGLIWRNEWLNAEKGIIPENYGEEGTPHAFILIGWAVIKKKEYLIAQLSSTEEVGDKGWFFFSRSVTEKEFGKKQFKSLMFVDVDPEQFKKEYWSVGQKLLNFFISLYGIYKRIKERYFI